MNLDHDKYPYFIYPDIVTIREGKPLGEADSMKLRRRIAANMGDPITLRMILGMDPPEFAAFYPDMAKADLSTTDTIDSFLSRFGQKDAPVPRAAAEIPPEYHLEEPDSHSSLPDDDTASAISSFLNANPPSAATCRPTAKCRQEAPATMAEADLLIKKHDYKAALEIIMQLSLINPKKSIYFADQIRFLRKLILNESKQNNLQGQ